MQLGNRLKELRQQKNISQTEFSNLMGISRSAVSMYEMGKRTPDYSVLCQFADFFHVSTDYLLGKTSVPTGTILKSVSAQAEPINGLINELFADRPDVLALLKNGVYDSDGKYSGKKLADLSDVAKKHLRDTIISVLEMSGYLHAK